MDDLPRDKLAKLLRMLTSSFEGEVLSAAARINGLVQSYGIDWDSVLSNGSGLSREQMRAIYTEAYQRGLADGAASTSRPQDDWAPAGQSRADEVGDRYDEVRGIIEAVKANGGSDFETEFAESMAHRLQSWGRRTFISEKQWKVLDRMRARHGQSKV